MKAIRIIVWMIVICLTFANVSQEAAAGIVAQTPPTCVRTSDLPISHPNQFPGAFFLYTESLSGGIEFEVLTADGIQALPSIPQPIATLLLSRELFIDVVSPDGRLVIFGPTYVYPGVLDATVLPTTPFYVWDMHTGDVAPIPLSQQDIELFFARELDANTMRFSWLDNDTLRLHYWPVIDSKIQETIRTINISTTPLNISVASLVTVPIPPAPSGNPNAQVAVSSEGNYITVRTLGTSGRDLQIFMNDGSQIPVYTLQGSPSLQAENLQSWSPDEQYFLTQIRDENFSFLRPLVLDTSQGFAEYTGLNDAIVTVAGSDARFTRVFEPSWSSDSEVVIVSLDLDDNDPSIVTRHLGAYDFTLQTIQFFCTTTAFLTDAVTTFWSPDNLYFGYLVDGIPLIMNVDTGDYYRLPSTIFDIGWISEIAVAILGFEHVNTSTNESYGILTDNASINLSDNLAIRAGTVPIDAGSVVFSDGTTTITDNTAPFEFPITAEGTYTLTATPFSEPDGNCYRGTSRTITFTVNVAP